MAANLPVFTDKDRNRAKNKKASDEAIPFVYTTVIAWGCDKEEHESFIDYYNKRSEKLWNDNKEKWEEEVKKKLINLTVNWPEEKKRKEKEECLNKLKKENLKKLLIKETWTKVEMNRLSQENCEGLDVTLLHKLVPTICDGIGRYDPNAPSSTEIEKFLKEVKDIRNEICHDPKGASVSDSILDELEASAVNVFQAAGVLYASFLDKQKVQDKINKLTKMLQNIKEEVMTDGYQLILQTAKKLTQEGKAEMGKAVQKQATDDLPYNDGKFTRTDIFYDVRVSMRMENENEDAELPEDKRTVEFGSTEILQNRGGDVLLCEGEPGSGKTTLLRRLQEDYFATGKKIFTGLDMFDLLIFMDCRDNTLKDIIQLLKRIFPKTMNQLKEDEALRSLHELKLLICVDGLDELNQNSRKLLDELIKTFHLHGEATFVCTSRPGRYDSLSSVQYRTMSLQPVTQEKEQIAFLEGYQAKIKGIAAPELIQAFKSLGRSCKDCLSRPIYLALFCYLFRKFRQGVCLWKNELSIMEHILTLSEQTMIKRMQTMNFENPEDYADDVTKAITELSVQLVYRGEVTIDRNTYTELRRNIFDKAEVPHYSIMSSYFTQHADGQSFNFYHKSYLEFLAAKQLYKSFVSNKSASIISAIMSHQQDPTNMSDAATTAIEAAPAPVVTGGTDVSVRQFDNAFRFLTIMLAEGGPAMREALKSFLKEVYPALVREQIGFHYWVEITNSCNDSDIVVEAAAKAAKTDSEEKMSPNQRKWQITTRRDMSAVSLMLPYHQPAWLDIRPLRSEGLPAELKPLLKAVAEWHTGQLDFIMDGSLNTFFGNDDLVICMKSARFTLRHFRACIGQSREAWQVLAAAARRAAMAGVVPDLAIALADPRQHQLDELEGTRHCLGILAQLNPSEVGQRCPLSRSSVQPPNLNVNCRLVTGECVECVTKTTSLIEDLAPEDGRYGIIALQQWHGTDVALSLLLLRLFVSGVSTVTAGSLQWYPVEEWFIPAGINHSLVNTTVSANSTSRDGLCHSCLSIHRDQKEWGRCVILIVPERDPRDAVEVTRVDTDDVMRQVTSSLPHIPIPWLVVITRRSGSPPPALGPLMETVAECHQGNLDLDFHHSFRDFVPVDELLARLHPAQCPLGRFVGCLSGSSENAWRALVEGVKRAELAKMKQSLSISLLDPKLHELGKLDGTRHDLYIRVLLPSSPGDRRPLPTSSLIPPSLIVQFSPAAGSNASADEETPAGPVAALIEDLAPEDMRYTNLYLQHYPGTDSALNDMLARLGASGVRMHGSTASWSETGNNSKEDCQICGDSSHRPRERCLMLLLP